MKTYQQQQKHPLAEKALSMNSPTPISHWWPVDIFRLSLLLSYSGKFDSTDTKVPPSGENIFNE
jgi:hypothetical protein